MAVCRSSALRVSLNSRAFWIAMTAWSANVFSRACSRSLKPPSVWPRQRDRADAPAALNQWRVDQRPVDAEAPGRRAHHLRHALAVQQIGKVQHVPGVDHGSRSGTFQGNRVERPHAFDHLVRKFLGVRLPCLCPLPAPDRRKVHQPIFADQVDRHDAGGEKVCAAVDDLLEDRLRIGHRAADDLQNLGSGCLVSQRQPDVIDQARVFQRHTHARSHRLEQTHPRCVESVLTLMVLHPDESQDPVAGDDRHDDGRMAPVGSRRRFNAHGSLLGARVQHHRFAQFEELPKPAVRVDFAGRPMRYRQAMLVVVERPYRFSLRVPPEHAQVTGAEHLAQLVADHLHDAIEVEAARDGALDRRYHFEFANALGQRRGRCLRLAFELLHPLLVVQRHGSLGGKHSNELAVARVKAAHAAFHVGIEITENATLRLQRRHEARALLDIGDALRAVPQANSAGAARFSEPGRDGLQQPAWIFPRGDPGSGDGSAHVRFQHEQHAQGAQELGDLFDQESVHLGAAAQLDQSQAGIEDTLDLRLLARPGSACRRKSAHAGIGSFQLLGGQGVRCGGWCVLL